MNLTTPTQSYSQITLQQHQVEGIEWLKEGYREGISRYLLDEPGLGKTVQLCEAFIQTGPHKCALFVVPKSVLYWWYDELERAIGRHSDDDSPWMKDPYWEPRVLVVDGQKDRRLRLWNLIRACHTYPASRDMFEVSHVAITTYGIVRQDSEVLRTLNFPLVVFDEAHRLIGRSTKTTQICKSLVTKYKAYVWMASGTPTSKGPEDIWPNLNILNRKLFSSYWKFIRTWFISEQTPYGTDILGIKPGHLDNMKLAVKPYLLKRRKDTSKMPPKTRSTIPVEMSSTQAKAYRDIERDMMTRFDSAPDEPPNRRYLLISTVLEKIIRLRQLLICPAYIDDSLGMGASLEATIEQIKDLGTEHVAIYCPFPSLFRHMARYLTAQQFQNPVELSGKTKADEVQDLIATAKARQCTILISIRYAEGFSIPSISHGFFLGSEYVPRYNIQAEDRIHRINSTQSVHVKYLLNRSTIEEDIYEILNDRSRKLHTLFGGSDLSHTALDELMKILKRRQSNQTQHK